ncbi:PilT-like protein [Beggiatoa sp. PS]|nr:PilT-like protein [Beggiatoa sp. PS]
MKKERRFLDSKLLIYTDDHDAPTKQTKALELFGELRTTNQGVISTQVLQEYFVVVTRKLAVPPDIARRKVQLFANLNLIQIDLNMILAAIDLHRLHQLSFWNALIIRSALSGGCSSLLTEDLQHGQHIEGLEIINPFL